MTSYSNRVDSIMLPLIVIISSLPTAAFVSTPTPFAKSNTPFSLHGNTLQQLVQLAKIERTQAAQMNPNPNSNALDEILKVPLDDNPPIYNIIQSGTLSELKAYLNHLFIQGFHESLDLIIYKASSPIDVALTSKINPIAKLILLIDNGFQYIHSTTRDLARFANLLIQNKQNDVIWNSPSRFSGTGLLTILIIMNPSQFNHYFINYQYRIMELQLALNVVTHLLKLSNYDYPSYRVYWPVIQQQLIDEINPM
eukprot:NODE_279_length_10886_cov_0.340039.p5 type:complete len:253 gc:universal NODE_279_length_10886_cov_0.340039:8801-8043(-)